MNADDYGPPLDQPEHLTEPRDFDCCVNREHEPPEYLDLRDVAERAGITPESARTYHKRASSNRAVGRSRPGDLPPEDIRLGRTPGWAPATITAWLDSRPRSRPDTEGPTAVTVAGTVIAMTERHDIAERPQRH